MDKIELLLEKLDNRIPQTLANKIDKLDDFEEKLLIAQNEYTDEPTRENKEILKEVTDFVNELKAEIESNLQKLVYQKETKEKEEKGGTPAPQPAPASTDGKPAEQVDDKDKDKDKDKKGMSVFGVVLGVTLLVATAGAYNYFSKNK
jgi:hypothetical protein